MSDWFGILVIAVLFVAVVVSAVVLFINWQEQEHSRKRASEELPTATQAVSPPVNPPANPLVKPRIVLRRPAQNGHFKRRPLAETKFKRKQIASPPNPKPKEKMKTRGVKIDLDEIHKLTGLPIRICPCEQCEEMRANVGS